MVTKYYDETNNEEKMKRGKQFIEDNPKCILCKNRAIICGAFFENSVLSDENEVLYGLCGKHFKQMNKDETILHKVENIINQKKKLQTN